MTHPEINLSWVSHALRANGTQINADFLLISENQRLSASKIKFEVNHVISYLFPNHIRASKLSLRMNW